MRVQEVAREYDNVAFPQVNLLATQDQLAAFVVVVQRAKNGQNGNPFTFPVEQRMYMVAV